MNQVKHCPIGQQLWDEWHRTVVTKTSTATRQQAKRIYQSHRDHCKICSKIAPCNV